MRAAILPYRLIILTKAYRATVSMKVERGIVTASEVFLIFTTQIY